jgi:C_GCAxxG_C_C family probable redox protein
VLLAVSEALAENSAPAISQSKDFTCDCIPRIGTGLAGGIGLQGEVCGALVGGVLIIGLLYGTDEPNDEIKYAAYAKTVQYVEAFKSSNEATHCRELINIDFSMDDHFETYNDLNLKEKVCAGVVTNAVLILMNLLQEWDQPGE